MAVCEGGAALDLTRGLMIWVEAHWGAGEQRLQLMAGEGLGVFADSGELCLSSYARELLEINLLPLLPALPQGSLSFARVQHDVVLIAGT